MDELTAFIEARLAEDEAMAKAATGPLSGRWRIDSDGDIQDEDTGGGGSAYIACGPWSGGLADEDAQHIARHDPARVLREVAAKRAILAAHAMTKPSYGPSAGEPCCLSCGAVTDDAYLAAPWPCDAVLAIAAVWSDHGDYRAEWAG